MASTTEAPFHDHHCQLQNSFFQVSFLFIINYLMTTYLFSKDCKIFLRLKLLWFHYLSHHHFHRLCDFLYNQNCQRYKMRRKPHIHVRTHHSRFKGYNRVFRTYILKLFTWRIERWIALLVEAKIRKEKVVCIFIVAIQGKCKASNLRMKNYKFSKLFKIFISVYYELKLKGFAYLEIFLTNHEAIKLWSDLVGSIKKPGQNKPVKIYC